MARPDAGGTEVVEGVELKNLDAELFEGAGATKRDLVEHVRALAVPLVAELHGRPLTVTRVRHDRLLVAMPHGHRFARRQRLRVADLAGEDLVVHAGGGRSAMNTLVQDLFDDAGHEARVVHQVAETSTLVTFVAAGLGIAVVPEPTAALAVPGVVYVSLVGVPGIELVAAHRNDDANPVLARALAALSAVAAG